MPIQRWTVGAFTITSVIEEENARIPPELFFPVARAEDVARHAWLIPEFADTRGRISMRVQAFVVEGEGRRVIVDPCVGNDKKRPIPYWNERSWPFLERLGEAGFDTDAIDAVVHTHLHADHVGWGTRLLDGVWVPTFARARYLYTARELAWCKAGGNPGIDGVYADSILPVLEAGLADVVSEDERLGPGVFLEPSPGHTPGHVSLWIESQGEVALITGDILHHPVQCAEPGWAELGDEDAEQARATRKRMLARAAERGALFVGTHFPSRPAGRLASDGDAWRFVPSP